MLLVEGTGNIEAIWTRSLKIKNRGQRFVSVSNFANEFVSFAGYVFMSFSWAFYHKNLAFFPEIYL